eukprot:TRINITY_DN31591_c1_g1_i2.p3 TRINITY_DN31591_c1_g1~~TRINITY_DN31591_c1_g1_i2.p3  ORF type:complete len:112 (-),score=1.38 TRINITY_DN31591_c1_g1_i2:298-633(-)
MAQDRLTLVQQTRVIIHYLQRNKFFKKIRKKEQRKPPNNQKHKINILLTGHYKTTFPREKINPPKVIQSHRGGKQQIFNLIQTQQLINQIPLISFFLNAPPFSITQAKKQN